MQAHTPFSHHNRALLFSILVGLPLTLAYAATWFGLTGVV
jgi:hypothetical protein